MTDHDLLGTKLGHFRIVDLLGEGGMGSVFVGFDDLLQRKVALKAVHRGRLDADTKARFVREARVLSQLKHPHICQIYDFLEAPDRDFLVLELIEGKDLKNVIASRPDAALKARIAHQLAEVLVATHSKAIIHRDLKPANVMVTAEGDIKVLDFGLARGAAAAPSEDLTMTRLDDSPSAANAHSDYAVTSLGALVGTLSYMSPEQARGEPVTTASDMYSYGLVIQELFTEKSAYLPGLNSADQLAKAKAGETVPVVGLDKDLTALINRLKAPAAAVRPTALDTVERLDRIAAAPQLRRRRMLKWGAAAVLALVAVGMSYQTWRINRQAQRITEEATRANQEAQSAKEVSEFLVKLFQLADPSQNKGATVTARELLDKASQDIDLRLTDQPLVKARLEFTLAEVYESLGLADPAFSLAEKSLDLRKKNLAANDPAVADTLRQLGNIWALRGDYNKAAPLLQSAAEMQEKSLGPESPALAATLNDVGVAYRNQRKTDEAERVYLRAIKIYEKNPLSDDADVAEVLGDLAYLYYTEGRYSQAEPLLQRAITGFEKAGGPNDPRLAVVLSQLGGVYRDQGKSVLAEPLFLRAVAIEEKVLGPNHPYLALRLSGLAMVYREQGKSAQQEELLLRATSILENAVGPNNVWLAQTLNFLALVYRDEGKNDQGEKLTLRAISMFEKVRGPESIDTASALVLLAELYQKSKPSQVGPLLTRALANYEKATSRDAYSRSVYVRALELAGRTADARIKAEELAGQGFWRKDFRQLCEKLGVKRPSI